METRTYKGDGRTYDVCLIRYRIRESVRPTEDRKKAELHGHFKALIYHEAFAFQTVSLQPKHTAIPMPLSFTTRLGIYDENITTLMQRASDLENQYLLETHPDLFL